MRKLYKMQKLKNPCEAPKSRLIRGAKNRNQGRSSASADFLLESDKRGSPPKSEKRSFWRVGGAGRGVQPFCKKEKCDRDSIDFNANLSAKSRKAVGSSESQKDKRASFTMIEIVFVIVITGLVATAGSKAIVQILQNYALQKEFAKVEMDSASAIRQISNYLQNSIWDSIAINTANTYLSMAYVNTSDGGRLGVVNGNTKRLYFIEKNAGVASGYYSNGSNYPLFSGFIDVNLSGGNVVVAQSESDKMVTYLNGDKMALFFPFVNVGTNNYVGSKYYSAKVTDNTAIFPIRAVNQRFAYNDSNGTRIQTNQEYMELFSTPKQIGDVATIVNLYPSILSLEDGSNANYEKGDLVVTTNVQTTQSTLIAKKVSNLHIWTESSSSLIRIRICFEAGVTKSIMDEFCKEGIIMQ